MKELNLQFNQSLMVFFVLQKEKQLLVDINEEEIFIWGVIDKNGELIFEVDPVYQRGHGIYSEGLTAAINEENQKRAYIDEIGNFVIEPQYQKVRPFASGIAPAMVDSLWGFINNKCEFAVEPQYEEVLYFSDGVASVLVDGLWGAIDTEVNMIIEPQYEGSFDFQEGLAPVYIGGFYGFIDKPSFTNVKLSKISVL